MKTSFLIALGVWVVTVQSGLANDAGDLIFPVDYPRKVRAELLYENVQRDVRVTSESPSVTDGLSADVFAVRLHTDLGPLARLDFDIGAMSAGSGSHKLMGGVGLRFLAFELGAWRGGAFGQVRYARDLSDRVDLAERARAQVKYDCVEADAGFLVGYRLGIADQFKVTPYAGPVFSIVRLSGDVRTANGRDRFRAEEDQVIGVAAGLGLEFQGQNGLRFEARYFDDISVSAAVSFVF